MRARLEGESGPAMYMSHLRDMFDMLEDAQGLFGPTKYHICTGMTRLEGLDATSKV